MYRPLFSNARPVNDLAHLYDTRSDAASVLPYPSPVASRKARPTTGPTISGRFHCLTTFMTEPTMSPISSVTPNSAIERVLFLAFPNVGEQDLLAPWKSSDLSPGP